MTSLSEKLSRLGIKKADEIIPAVKMNNLSLQELLNASIVENSLGKVLLRQKQYEYGYCHGNVEFQTQLNTVEINKTNKSHPDDMAFENLVFLDTETTGLAGGTGTIAFLVGVGRFTKNGFEIQQFILEDPIEEPALLLALSSYCDGIEGIVTFNGKSFDIPLLRTRYILSKLPHSIDQWGHLDLLHLSRRIWKQRLPSRSLKDLEQEILHLPRTEDEVPGWMIPEIYFNYLRTGDGKLLKNVAYHNEMDIVSLAALFLSINQMLQKELFDGKHDFVDIYSIGLVYESIAEYIKAVEIYEYCVQNGHFSIDLKIELFQHLGYLYKRESKWEEAAALWMENSKNGDFISSIELAKYFEHEKKSPEDALEWTKRAELNIEKASLSRYKMNSMKKEISKRRNRLEKRIDENV